LAGARAAIVVLLGCLFWIFTAWPSGAVAVLMSAVVACLFGNSPIGPSLIRRYLWGVGIGIVVAALYGYAILPRITDPVLYASVLAPPLLLFGGLLSRPERALQANALLVGFINTVGLAATYRGDFAIFANTALGLAMGIGFSALVISWTLIDSANLAAMGLLRSAYRDVARRADQEEGDSAAWITRMLDRIALLYTRLQSKETDPTTPVMAALTDMRTGLLAGSLRELRGQTSDAENGTLDRILRGIQCHYRELNPRAPSLPADPLLREIDRGLHAFLDQNSLRARRGLELLTGLRRNLFPSAAPPTATAL
jgi:uncharacterized membrane protein YccC